MNSYDQFTYEFIWIHMYMNSYIWIHIWILVYQGFRWSLKALFQSLQHLDLDIEIRSRDLRLGHQPEGVWLTPPVRAPPVRASDSEASCHYWYCSTQAGSAYLSWMLLHPLQPGPGTRTATAAWAWNKEAHWMAMIERTRRILSGHWGLLAQPEPNRLPSLAWTQRFDGPGQTQPEWPMQTSSSKSTAEFKAKNLKTLAESTTRQIQGLKICLN